MDSKPKVRVTYGRPKPVITEAQEPIDDALPPSSPPPKQVDQSSSLTLTEESAIAPDEVEDRASFAKSSVVGSEPDEDEDMEDADEVGFNWDWKKKLAALDESDDEEPVPVAPRSSKHEQKRAPTAGIFSGSLPDLTSSPMPSTSPPPSAAIRATRRVLSTSPTRASPKRAGTRETDESSALSEGPSKLFESPEKPNVISQAETPDSSPLKSASKPSDDDDLAHLFSPAASATSRHAASPKSAEAASPRGGRFSPQSTRAVSHADNEVGSNGEDGDGSHRKKLKKLNKKEIDEMNKETARILAAQDASIPRYENRLSLTSLFKTIQMANSGSTPQGETSAATQLKKLPRPTSKVYVERAEKLAPVEDDPIIDASSPFLRTAQKFAPAPAPPSSSAPTSSQVPAQLSSTPERAVQRTLSAPLAVFPPSNDPDDDLPDPAALLAEERAQRLQQMKAEEEKRRQYKLALLQRRQEQSLRTAAELLQQDSESDTELEIDDDQPKSVKKTPGSAKKNFLDRLVQTMPGHKSRRSADVPTDSQLNRAAKPHFDISSPPSAGKKDPFIGHDALNRSLLRKARRLAEEESKRKEEEWRSRGGKKRELKEEDIKAAIQEALAKQEAAAAARGHDEGEDDDEDEDWAPSDAGSEQSGDENAPHAQFVEDEAMDEDAGESSNNVEAPSVRSPSYADSNKENDNENKENVAPSQRSARSVLGEMQIDRSPLGDQADSDCEDVWRPRKKRKLVGGAGLVLDDDDEPEDDESTPMGLPRKLFSDPTAATQESDAPRPLAIPGGSFGESDVLGSAFGSGLGGGLSQFFAESQAPANPLSQLRHAAVEELERLPVSNLLPAVELSTQQIEVQEDVFREDQEARVQEALRAVNEKANRTSRPEMARVVLAESFPLEDFTQREGIDAMDDFAMDFVASKSVPEEGDGEMESPSAQSPQRLGSHEESMEDEALSFAREEESPEPNSPPRQLNAFEIMQKNAEREARKARRKRIQSLFMEGEAEEEEEEAMLGFGLSKDDHESDEDSENDVVLPELVDDKAMDDDTIAKEKVLEKVAEHQAEDDAALEKYHRDVIEGKKRMRRRGDDFLSDDEDEDDRRRYVPLTFRRKDGAPELEALATNPDTRAFYQSYQNTIMAKDDHEFDHLNAPIPQDSEDEADSEDGQDENRPAKVIVSAAQLREELRQAARNKAAIEPVLNPEDVSWVDRDDSDHEDLPRPYRNVRREPKARVAPVQDDEDLLLAKRPTKLDAKQQAKLQKFAKEDSYNASTSRGAAAVTGFVKSKPAPKAAPAKKTTVAAPRKSALFERQSKFA